MSGWGDQPWGQFPWGYGAGFLPFYATVDEGSQASPYAGMLKDPPEIVASLTDPLYGLIDYQETRFTLLNADGRFTPATVRALRGRGCTVKLLNATTNVIATPTWTGIIQSASMNGSSGEVEVEAASFAKTILTKLIPASGEITTTTFPSAIPGDVGKAAPICFGYVEKVKCLYVNDGGGGFYDYVITLGTGLSVPAVWRDDVNQSPTGTPTGAQSFRLIESGNYTIGELVDGYWMIRFTTRQVNSAGTLVSIYADVNGFQTEMHPVRGIQYMLSDTVWGLSEAVDTSAFDLATQQFTDLHSPDSITLDALIGAGGQAQPAQELLREWLQIVGGHLALNASGEWTISLDLSPASTMMEIGSGPFSTEQNIVAGGGGIREWASEDNRAKSVTLKYRLHQPTGTYQLRAARTLDTTGRDIVLDMPSLRSSRGADRVVDKLAKRLYYAQEHVRSVRMTIEGWTLSHSHWVAYTYVPNGCFRDIFSVASITKGIYGVTLDLERVSLSTNQYTPAIIGLPSEPIVTPPNDPPPPPPPTDATEERSVNVVTGSVFGSLSYQSIGTWTPAAPSITIDTTGNDLYMQAFLELLVLNDPAGGTGTVRLRDSTSGANVEVGPVVFSADPTVFPGYTVYVASFSASSLILQQNGVNSGAHTILLEFKTTFATQEVFYGSRDVPYPGLQSSAYVFMRESA